MQLFLLNYGDGDRSFSKNPLFSCFFMKNHINLGVKKSGRIPKSLTSRK